MAEFRQRGRAADIHDGTVTSKLETTSVRHPAGRHVDVGGHRLWVETQGRGDRVVLLAGLGPAGSHVVFHPHFTPLADSVEVVYVDLYGRGRSDVPADLREITFAGDVADVARLLDEIGPSHVYGFSYGGLVAQAVALDHPDLVRSLVLANSLHSPEMWQLNHENINREIANQAPEVWERIQQLRREGVPSTDPRMQEQFAVHARLVRFFNSDNAGLLATEPGARNVELYPIFCGADVDFVIGGEIARIPDFRPRLHELRMPLLVLAGRHDRALYPALQRQILDFAPNARLRFLERSGSFGHVEEPATVISLVRDFVSG